MQLTIQRQSTDDEGTFGVATLDSDWTCYSLELPWRDNISGKSCIPPGTYECGWINSPKHGWCYKLKDVPDRTDVEIHSANWAGDADKGFKCQLLGCIALGLVIGELEGQKAVLSSKATIEKFHEITNGGALTVTIVAPEGDRYGN
jgi:hypothetical protein